MTENRTDDGQRWTYDFEENYFTNMKWRMITMKGGEVKPLDCTN